MKSLIATVTLAATTAGLFAAVPAAAAPASHAVATAIETGAGAEWNRSDRGRKEGWRKNGKAYRNYSTRAYNPYGGYNGYNAYNNGGYYGDPVYRNTRVWQGDDGRYYCRRSNGTTGLLIGGAAGALLGRELAGRGDQTLGAVLGAAAGALLGREIDNGGSRCR